MTPRRLSAAQLAQNADRFWAHVDKDGPDGCWTWTGDVYTGGYGRMSVAGKSTRIHRFAYELLRGTIPDGLHIDHLCRNRQCVNPAHREVVTLVENVMRGESPQARNARKTHCVNGHEFTPENTYYRKGGRACRACQRERQKRWKAKAGAA